MNENFWWADTQQKVFRKLVNAFSYSGTIETLPDVNGQADLAILASLIDGSSRFSDPHHLLTDEHLVRLQADPEGPETAGYIFCNGENAVDIQPSRGTLTCPEFGALLVIKITDIESGFLRFQLTGPGIKDSCEIAPNGLHHSWFSRREDWNAGFPLGVDLLLVTADAFVAIPRTITIKEV